MMRVFIKHNTDNGIESFTYENVISIKPSDTNPNRVEITHVIDGTEFIDKVRLDEESELIIKK